MKKWKNVRLGFCCFRFILFALAQLTGMRGTSNSPQKAKKKKSQFQMILTNCIMLIHSTNNITYIKRRIVFSPSARTNKKKWSNNGKQKDRTAFLKALRGTILFCSGSSSLNFNYPKYKTNLFISKLKKMIYLKMNEQQKKSCHQTDEKESEKKWTRQSSGVLKGWGNRNSNICIFIHDFWIAFVPIFMFCHVSVVVTRLVCVCQLCFFFLSRPYGRCKKPKFCVRWLLLFFFCSSHSVLCECWLNCSVTIWLVMFLCRFFALIFSTNMLWGIVQNFKFFVLIHIHIAETKRRKKYYFTFKFMRFTHIPIDHTQLKNAVPSTTCEFLITPGIAECQIGKKRGTREAYDVLSLD